MGKGEEHPLPTTITDPSQSTVTNSSNKCCCSVFGLFRFRCVFVLVLGLSVLLSAVFWLPMFQDHGDLDLDDVHYKGHDIVATFMIQKPLSLLQDDIPQLGDDIFDEIRFPTTKVVILTTEDIPRSNTTKIVFSVDPDEHYSKISSYAKSLVRDSFVSLVLHQSPLRLTESLFGEPSSFEVLKFVGGITVTPPDQIAYPLQKVQIRFNFTLNFSIEQILDHFHELTSQLKLGLHLSPEENLYVSLTNRKGSTVTPQTTVQSSVVLAIGTPSNERSKQLAQTIKGSPTKNLGLNNTQFGKVKQISLSSVFNSGGSPAPSPAPLPQPPSKSHHHHHHHHHHHDKQLPPAKAPSPNEKGQSKHSPAPPPVPTPAPQKSHTAKPPDHHKKKNAHKHPPVFPPVSPPVHPPHCPPPPPLRHLSPPPPPPTPRPPPPPRRRPSPPPPPPPPPPLSIPPPPRPLPPPPPVPEAIPASSPLPNVVFAGHRPPPKSDSDADPPDTTPSGSVLQPSSACAGLPLRAIPAFLVVILLHVLQQQ